MNVIKSQILELLQKQAGLNPAETEPLLEKPIQSEQGDYALAFGYGFIG